MLISFRKPCNVSPGALATGGSGQEGRGEVGGERVRGEGCGKWIGEWQEEKGHEGREGECGSGGGDGERWKGREGKWGGEQEGQILQFGISREHKQQILQLKMRVFRSRL